MRIISLEEEGERWPCVATIGFFDGVHLGHQYLIRRVCDLAAAEGLLSAVITFAVHPRQVVQPGYQPELLTSCDEKLALLEQTGVDVCVMLPFDMEMASMSARDFMSQVLLHRMNVRRLLVGYDHRFGHDRSESFDDYVRYGRELGIVVEREDALDDGGARVSSSRIRRCLLDGDMSEAARCLGRPYRLSGVVVGGERQGRRMGFPTANLRLPADGKLIPAAGVYAVDVLIDGEHEWRRAMMNIGTRPTFHGDHVTLEVHILHFQGDLYGHRLTVSFLSRLRAERQFDSPEALAAQLKRDMEAIVHEVKEVKEVKEAKGQ